MNTVILGVFHDQQAALDATTAIESAGFPRADLRLVDAATPDRHAFVQRRVADTKRAILIGMAIGPVLGVIAGIALADVFGTTSTLVVGAIGGAIGGTVLGYCVGRATSSQMTDELEHLVENGAVLVRMFVEPDRAAEAMRILSQYSGAQFTATNVTFSGGAVSVANGEGVGRRPAGN